MVAVQELEAPSRSVPVSVTVCCPMPNGPVESNQTVKRLDPILFALMWRGEQSLPALLIHHSQRPIRTLFYAASRAGRRGYGQSPGVRDRHLKARTARRFQYHALAVRLDVDLAVSYVELGLRSARPNAYVSVGGRAVDARDGAEDERIVGCRKGVGADGGGERQIARANIRAPTEGGVSAACLVEVAREHSEEGVLAARRIVMSRRVAVERVLAARGVV